MDRQTIQMDRDQSKYQIENHHELASYTKYLLPPLPVPFSSRKLCRTKQKGKNFEDPDQLGLPLVAKDGETTFCIAPGAKALVPILVS